MSYLYESENPLLDDLRSVELGSYQLDEFNDELFVADENVEAMVAILKRNPEIKRIIEILRNLREKINQSPSISLYIHTPTLTQVSRTVNVYITIALFFDICV